MGNVDYPESLRKELKEIEEALKYTSVKFELTANWSPFIKYFILRKRGVISKELEKELGKLFEKPHFEIVKNLKYKYLCKIAFTNDYLALIFNFITVKYYNFHVYIIGFNDNGKCFIHKTDEHTEEVFTIEEKVYDNDIKISYIHGNEAFYQALGYFVDLTIDGYNKLLKEVSSHSRTLVRVQGDIILEILPDKRYFVEIFDQVRNQTWRIILQELYNRVMAVLEDYGLSSRLEIVGWRNMVTIDGLNANLTENTLFKIINQLCTILLNDLYVADLLPGDINREMFPSAFGSEQHASISLPNGNELIRLVVRYRRPNFPDNRRVIEIELFDRYKFPKIVESIYNYAKSLIKENEQEITEGRHRFTWVGYPRNVIFTYRLLGREFLFSVSPQAFGVTKSLTITHPEHLPVIIDLNKPFSFTISHVTNAIRHRINHYRLMMLTK